MKILILLICIPILYFGQLSPKVDELYQKLSKSKRYESKNIGLDGHESEVYKIHTEIGKIATDQELKYIAVNGNSITKKNISNILFSKKSKLLPSLFKEYLKTNDSVHMQSGCVGYDSFLPNEIYKNVAYEKGNINEAEYYKKWKDSLISSKKQLDSIDLFLIEDLKSETNWKMKEIDSLLYKFDQIALNYKESPWNIIEIICQYHLFENYKVPYFKKIAYFEKKNNSEYIRKYMKFCRTGIREQLE